jgi:rhodanese-related sulfurtransferase
MRIIALLCITVLYALPVAATQYQTVSVDNLQQMLAGKNIIVLDVRTFEERRRGRLAKTETHLDYFAPHFDKKLFALSEKPTYLVYCHNGGRGRIVAERMAQMGYKVWHLEGGIEAFYAEFPKKVIEAKGPPMPPKT